MMNFKNFPSDRVSHTRSLLILNNPEDGRRVFQIGGESEESISEDAPQHLSHTTVRSRSRFNIKSLANRYADNSDVSDVTKDRVNENTKNVNRSDSVSPRKSPPAEQSNTLNKTQDGPRSHSNSARKSVTARHRNSAYDHRLNLFTNLFGLKGLWLGKKKRESVASSGKDVDGMINVTGKLSTDIHEDVNIGVWKKIVLGTHKLEEKPKKKKLSSMIIEKKSEKFITKSMYHGYWDTLFENMDKEGLYMMPHGVIYEGGIHDGMFHGHGTLHYPNGCSVEGIWEKGEIIKRKFVFADGNEFEDDNFDYCEKPDRRYATEKENGLKPAGRSQITNVDPPRPIPDGCYDTGAGFYNPMTKCIMNPKTGGIMRIPIRNEEEWIIRHCRKAWDENVGFRPELYEDWFTLEAENSEYDVFLKNLQLSKEDSTVAFTPSQIKMMEEALSIKSPDLSIRTKNLDASSGVFKAAVSWLKPTSKPSEETGETRLEWLRTVNLDYAVTRDSRVSDMIPED